MNEKLTKGGKRYFLTFIDDCTRFCYVYLLKIKDEVLHYFKIYKAEVENLLGRKIKHLGFDRGGEYFSNEFFEFYAVHGIIHERTPPYSTESNGIAERKNHTVTDLVNAMLETAGLSKECWGEAILAACHVLNRVPEQREYTIRGMGEEEIKSFLPANLGLFGKGESTNKQKAKAWTKNC